MASHRAPGHGDRPVRAAIVGTGGIAAAHAAALRAHPDEVARGAVADVDHDRAAAFADRWQTPAAVTDMAGVLAHDVDLVHVCTPPGTHAPLSVQALRAGVHVLLEKPPALSLAEVDAVLAVQDEVRGTGRDGADPQVAVVFQHRFGPAALRLRRMLDDGALGRPLLATCHTEWYRDAAYFDVPWRGRWDVEGGGPTMGHGIHQMDLLLSVLGPWQEVTAMAARQARRTETEDVSMAVLQTAGGALVSVVNSVLSPREVSELRFDTERATIELTHLYGYTDADWRFTPAPGHEDLAARWTADATERVPAAGRHAPGEAAPTGTSHQTQVAALLSALRAGASLPVPLVEARHTLELAAALYASAFTGRRVRRDEIGPGHPFYERMDGTGAPWPST